MPPENRPVFAFRSDTRHPEEIFREGFSPRLRSSSPRWWEAAVRFPHFGKGHRAIDCHPAKAVCLSTRFESAVLFPTTENAPDTYVYFVALPHLSSSILLKNGRLEIDMRREAPTNPKRIAFDLHQYQMIQTNQLIDLLEKKARELPYQKPLARDHAIMDGYQRAGIFAGWPLFGYELIARYIPPASIIGAVKICRTEASNQTMYSPDAAHVR